MNEIERQLRAVVFNGTTANDLKVMQRETGIKDVQAQRCIDQAYKELERLREENTRMADSDKHNHMQEWLEEQKEHLNPFFRLICRCIFKMSDQ